MKHKMLLAVFSGFFLLGTMQAQIVSFTAKANRNCFGQIFTLKATGIPDSLVKSYAWDLDNDGVPDVFGKADSIIQTDFTYYYQQGGSFPVTLSITTTANKLLTMSAPIHVDVFSVPEVSFSVTNVCNGNQAHFIDLTKVPDNTTTITKRMWDFKNDGNPENIANDSTPTFFYGAVNTYTAKLAVTYSNGCSGSATQSVTVYPKPSPEYSFTQQCNGIVTNFTDTSKISNDVIASRLWTFGDGTGASGKTVQHDYTLAGTDSVKLTVTSANGCSDSISHTVTVNPPRVDFTSLAVCAHQSTDFTASVATISACVFSCNWDFGDGTTATGTEVNHLYATSSSYTAKLKMITDAGYTDSITKTIQVNTLPTVQLTFAGDSLIYTNSNKSVTLDAAGNFTSSLWSTGETGTSITVNKSDTYWVQVTNADNCVSSDTIKILSKDVSTLKIASDIITPNGDGINDYFKIQDIGAYASINLTIYNRWGVQVYSNSNYKNDWDGASLDAGAYYYEIKNVGNKIITGNINILR